jgi:hypothetical protein
LKKLFSVVDSAQHKGKNSLSCTSEALHEKWFKKLSILHDEPEYFCMMLLRNVVVFKVPAEQA